MNNRKPVEKPKTWCWWEEEKTIINTIKPWTDKPKRISLNIV